MRPYGFTMKTTPTITGHLTCPRHHPELFTQTTSFIRNPSKVALLPPEAQRGARAAGRWQGRRLGGRYTPHSAHRALRVLSSFVQASVKTTRTSVLTWSTKEENTKHPVSKRSIYAPFDFSLKLVTKCDDVKSCPHGWALLTFQKLYFKIQPFGEGKWESSPSPRDINYIKNRLIKDLYSFNKKSKVLFLKVTECF